MDDSESEQLGLFSEREIIQCLTSPGSGPGTGPGPGKKDPDPENKRNVFLKNPSQINMKVK